MPKRKKKKMADEAKRRIQIIDRDLYHLRELRRGYSKRLLRTGMAVWVAGLLIFSATAFLWIGPALAFSTFNVWAPLLIIALVAPVVITAVFVRKLDIKERQLEQLRKGLLNRFEKAMLKKMEKMVGKH